MTRRLRLDMAILLPDVPDAKDACVARLQSAVSAQMGVVESHVVQKPEGSVLCIHYEPERLSLSTLQSLVRRAGAELSERYDHAVLPVRLVDAEDAARRVEDQLQGMAGVLAASVSIPAQRVRLELDTQLTSVDKVREALDGMGYQSSPPAGRAPTPGCCRPKEPIPDSAGWLRRNRELALSLGAGVLTVAAWAGQRWLGVSVPASTVMFAAAYVLGGWDLISHWLGAVRKGKLTFDIDLLMLLAAIGAAVLGEWAEGAFLLFLFSLAHALEHYAMGRARNAIKALADLAPATAYVLRGGETVEVPVEEVKAGDVVVVRPAERISVDGVVASGTSSVNQAPITGESIPVDKKAGDEVFAGTINGEGALQITTTRVAGDRTLDRVVTLVEQAQTQKAPTQLFTERFERIFVPTVLVADALLIIAPPLLGLWTWDVSFYRGMAMLVASSPCALALGTPSAVLAGIAQAARNGVLIKGGAHLENMGALNAIAFDKTGTLTIGEPQVTQLVPFTGSSDDELLSIAAAVEQHSQHPLAHAIVQRAKDQGLQLPAAGDMESITARGVRASVGNEMVEIGNLRLWEEAGVTISDYVTAAVVALREAGQSFMVVRAGERWLGAIGISDRPRPGVKLILEELREMGVGTLVMLTGDNAGVGAAIGREVGVTEVKADLLPEDKVTALKELLTIHGKAGMVGDGINDAPALAHATVGIAMGGAGTAVALETADIALMSDDLSKLPFAVGLSRRARSVIKQNLAASLAVIALLVVATVTGVFGIGPAVLVHEGSTLIVIGNSLRLLAYAPPSAAGVGVTSN